MRCLTPLICLSALAVSLSGPVLHASDSDLVCYLVDRSDSIDGGLFFGRDHRPGIRKAVLDHAAGLDSGSQIWLQFFSDHAGPVYRVVAGEPAAERQLTGAFDESFLPGGDCRLYDTVEDLLFRILSQEQSLRSVTIIAFADGGDTRSHTLEGEAGWAESSRLLEQLAIRVPATRFRLFCLDPFTRSAADAEALGPEATVFTVDADAAVEIPATPPTTTPPSSPATPAFAQFSISPSPDVVFLEQVQAKAENTGADFRHRWVVNGDRVYEGAEVSFLTTEPGLLEVVHFVRDGDGNYGMADASLLVGLAPADRPSAGFTMVPSFPEAGQRLTFEASEHTAEHRHRWILNNREVGDLPFLDLTIEEPGSYALTHEVTRNGIPTAKGVEFFIRQRDTLEASFTVTNTSGSPPLEVRFNDLSEGQITTWLWDFGDGNSSGESNPVHVYTQPGNYRPTLTVANRSGRASTVQLDDRIRVAGPITRSLPTAFEPIVKPIEQNLDKIIGVILLIGLIILVLKLRNTGVGPEDGKD